MTATVSFTCPFAQGGHSHPPPPENDERHSPQKENTHVPTDKHGANIGKATQMFQNHLRDLTMDKLNYSQPAVELDSSHCNSIHIQVYSNENSKARCSVSFVLHNFNESSPPTFEWVTGHPIYIVGNRGPERKCGLPESTLVLSG